MDEGRERGEGGSERRREGATERERGAREERGRKGDREGGRDIPGNSAQNNTQRGTCHCEFGIIATKL